jgi:hypothetical protein
MVGYAEVIPKPRSRKQSMQTAETGHQVDLSSVYVILGPSPTGQQGMITSEGNRCLAGSEDGFSSNATSLRALMLTSFVTIASGIGVRLD